MSKKKKIIKNKEKIVRSINNNIINVNLVPVVGSTHAVNRNSSNARCARGLWTPREAAVQVEGMRARGLSGGVGTIGGTRPSGSQKDAGPWSPRRLLRRRRRWVKYL